MTPGQVDLEPIFSPFVHKDLLGGSGDSIEIFWNSREQKTFTPNGSYSDSTKASPEKGKQYHEYMVKNLVKSTTTELDDDIIEQLHRPVQWSVVLAGAVITLQMFIDSEHLADKASKVIYSGLIILWTMVGIRVSRT